MFRIYISRITVISALFLVSQTLSAQSDKQIDSLTAILNKQSSSDTLTVNRMNELSQLLVRKSELELATSYAQKAQKISEKLHYKFGEAIAYNIIGMVYVYQNNYPEALNNLFVALKKWEEIGDKLRTADSYNHVGIVYLYQGNYPEALKNFFAGLKIFEEVEDKKGIVHSYNNIGIVYKNQGKYPEALKNYFAALKIYEEIGDKRGIGMAYNNIGNVYQAQGKYPEALKNHLESLKIKEELGDKQEIAGAYINIGVNYKEQGKYPEALENYFEGLKLGEEIGDKKGIANAYNNIGLVEFELNRPASATKHYQKALALAREIGVNSLVRDIYFNFSLANRTLGNYKDAYENYEQYITYRDSLINEENEKKSLQASMGYEYEKKAAVIQAELKTRNIQRNAAIAGLVLMVLLTVFVFYFFRLRSRKLQVEKENLKLQHRELETIRETEQFKSRFLANISHEFRTPLTLINGHLEVLKENGRKQDLLHYEEMEQNGKRLLTLINQLLDLSKMESGQYKLQYKNGDVLNETSMLVQSFHSYAEQQGISLTLQQAENANALSANPFIYSSEALSVIITNLISNAIKYTPSGGNVTAVIDYRDNKLFVTVTDTGKGIAPEHLSKVFDRFYQVDEPGQRSYAGSGIGLSLARELAVLHGGNITADSPATGGCTFTVWLASSEATVSEMAPKAEQSFALYVEEEHHVQHDKHQNIELPIVLVVEDQTELRRFIVQNLGKEYHYVEASNGVEGLKLAEDLLPDLIISDVMMPDTNGFELCETLKSNVATSHIPIMLLTAKADQKDKLTGLETGADDYLTKPFSLPELKLRVRNILNFKESMRKKFEGNTIPSAQETSELNSRDRKFIDDLKQCVEHNISNSQFGVNLLADAVFLSTSQLARKLKTITAKTPADFIRNIRFERANELLKDGLSVTEVSWAVGFEDSVYFSKVFKKHFGFAPSSIKK